MRLIAATLALALLAASAASGADAVWTIAIVGRRDVVLPMRMDASGIPAADARLLGPELDVSVAATDGQVVIRDADGLTWRTSHGSTRLDGAVESRPLSAPVQVAQQAVFLPLDAIASLAGRRLVIDQRGRASLVPSGALPADPVPAAAPARPAARATSASAAGDVRAPSGWQLFELPKTPEERAASARDDENLVMLREKPGVKEVQPVAFDTLSLDTGFGFAQNGGAAVDMGGSGRYAGFRVSLSTFLTYGVDRFTYRSGRVAIESPGNTWTFEGGDLLSESRGIGRGIRLSRRIGQRWRPGISAYAQDGRVVDDRPALSYRDSLLLHRNVDVRGEVATDGSAFFATRVLAGQGSVEAFYRYTSWRSTTDRGLSASYSLFGAVTAYGGIRISDGPMREQWNMVGLAVPMFRQSSLSVEQVRNSRAGMSDISHALGLQIPLGNLRIIQRYQWTDVALLEGPSLFDNGRRQLQSMASWAPSSRLRFNYQVATQWYAGNQAQQWTELETVFRASGRTSFHAVTGLPQFNSPRRLRVGLQQQLPGLFRLAIDYGRLPVFESTLQSVPNAPRLLVMVRRTMRLHTPPGGADVWGTVRDDGGAPVHGAVVSLGRFVTTTDEAGRYRFFHVPLGKHAVALLNDHLPAAYANANQPVGLTVLPNRDVQVDVRVTALRAIHGRIVLAGRSTNRIDEQTGMGGIVVRLDRDGPATITDDEGAFHFYNLQPGPYQVWVDTARLRQDLQVVGPARRTVDLQPDRPANNVDFRVSAREKPILMKERP